MSNTSGRLASFRGFVRKLRKVEGRWSRAHRGEGRGGERGWGGGGGWEGREMGGRWEGNGERRGGGRGSGGKGKRRGIWRAVESREGEGRRRKGRNLNVQGTGKFLKRAHSIVVFIWYILLICCVMLLTFFQ